MFVLAAIAVGIVLVTGDDSESPIPSTTVADSAFPTFSPEGDGKQETDKQPADKPSKDPEGGGAPKPASDGSDGTRSLTAAERKAKKVDCPYGREQCKLMWEAWKDRASIPLETGKNAECPYDREQCKLMKQAWKDRASIPLKTGGNPEKVDCPYDREQCKALWESWQAATE